MSGRPPFLLITSSAREIRVSVLFGPLPLEPIIGLITVIPIYEDDAARPLDELKMMHLTDTLRARLEVAP